MGGKPRSPSELVCPRGISIREFKTERRIQIAFSFRATECRELLPPGPITKSALTYASGLRTEILRKIADDAFHYSDYFPRSARAKQFIAGRRRSMRSLLDTQLDHYERQHAHGALSPSTLDGYRKAINSERMKFWDELTLGDVTPSKLRDWIGSLGVTPKRARNLLTPLRSVFEDALNDELIDFNPFDRIALNRPGNRGGSNS